MNTQNSKPGFSGWQKWALMSVIVVALSAIIIYFNVRVFDWADGAPYIAVVGFLMLISFIITLHIKRGSVTSHFLIAAFIFEVLLCVVLGINAVYSLSVMREMSVAGAVERQQQATVDSVSRLKGSRTQRKALEMLAGSDKVKTRQQVFADKERVLFWIMMFELGVGLVATFVPLGLSVFDKNKDGVPDFLQDDKARPGFAPSLPRRPNLRPAVASDESDASTSSRPQRGHFDAPPRQSDQEPPTDFDRAAAQRKLRDALRNVAFSMPGYSFKTDLKPDCVWISMRHSHDGVQDVVASVKGSDALLADALAMDEAGFQTKLEKFLTKQGFDLKKGESE